MNLSVRPASPDDARIIIDFNLALASESEDLVLSREIVERGVAHALADPALALYFVAEDDMPGGRRIVGQTMVTYEWSDWRDGMFWWIQSVFVDPAQRKHGVFRAIYKHIEAAARADATACGIRLYVEDNNLRAKQTYHALGMARGGYEVLEVDFRAPARLAAKQDH